MLLMLRALQHLSKEYPLCLDGEEEEAGTGMLEFGGREMK